ncbi:MAG: ectoine synthase [Dehalococcoidia bacterium]
MIVRTLESLVGTERDVRAPTFVSWRFLLAKDECGFSMHDTLLKAGTETSMWYRHHIEAVYCIEGEAELTVLDTGDVHTIVPGTLYALDGNEKHILRVTKDLRAICVFTPALVGPEVHDENGVYPLLKAEPKAPARRKR